MTLAYNRHLREVDMVREAPMQRTSASHAARQTAALLTLATRRMTPSSAYNGAMWMLELVAPAIGRSAYGDTSGDTELNGVGMRGMGVPLLVAVGGVEDEAEREFLRV